MYRSAALQHSRFPPFQCWHLSPHRCSSLVGHLCRPVFSTSQHKPKVCSDRLVLKCSYKLSRQLGTPHLSLTGTTILRVRHTATILYRRVRWIRYPWVPRLCSIFWRILIYSSKISILRRFLGIIYAYHASLNPAIFTSMRWIHQYRLRLLACLLSTFSIGRPSTYVLLSYLEPSFLLIYPN